MTREEQRKIRELGKLISIELRKQRKSFNFQFAHGYLYRFEGDFLYYSILSMPSNCLGILKVATFIKPWILNELYWEIQQMNMEEMQAQPKSFHVRGAFTINDIFYHNETVQYDEDNFGDSIHKVLVQFNNRIEEHKKHLPSVQTLTQNIEGYKISNLTKAIGLIYSHDYEKALSLLNQKDTVIDTYTHLSGDGKSAKDLAAEFCQVKLGVR